MTTTLLEVVRAFAYPRFPGTEAERRAAGEMARHFQSCGLAVEREPFEASRTAVARWRAIVHGSVAAGLLTQGMLAPAAPGAAGVLGIAILALVAGAGRWRRGLERAFDRGRMIASENVIGRRDGAGGPTLVFLAHLDSKSARLPTFFPVVLILLGMAAIAVTTIAALLAVAGRPTGVSFPLVAGLGAAAFLVALYNPHGNESPGAMDNASGLAVLHRAARRLPAIVELERAELLFLATGAEELGLCGSLRWIQAHAGELDPARTVFVNVDSVGVGRGLFALDLRGAAPGNVSLKHVVREAATAAGVRVRTIPFLPGVGVDTMPIGARGFAALTIMGQVLGGASRRIHSRRDTVEHLNEEGLQDAVAFVRELAREIVGRSS